eukprot:Platyproteum_vivax@DN5137_c0_g1_i1.p1
MVKKAVKAADMSDVSTCKKIRPTKLPARKLLMSNFGGDFLTIRDFIREKDFCSTPACFCRQVQSSISCDRKFEEEPHLELTLPADLKPLPSFGHPPKPHADNCKNQIQQIQDACNLSPKRISLLF